MGVGERSTFVVVGYLHFPETPENAEFLKKKTPRATFAHFLYRYYEYHIFRLLERRDSGHGTRPVARV